MTSNYFIEILSRTGEVIHRHQVADLPIRIGRAYDNDFILDDVHTAAHHAIVQATEDGKVILRDLGSKNGLVHLGKRQNQVLIDGHTVCVWGKPVCVYALPILQWKKKPSIPTIITGRVCHQRSLEY